MTAFYLKGEKIAIRKELKSISGLSLDISNLFNTKPSKLESILGLLIPLTLANGSKCRHIEAFIYKHCGYSFHSDYNGTSAGNKYL